MTSFVATTVFISRQLIKLFLGYLLARDCLQDHYIAQGVWFRYVFGKSLRNLIKSRHKYKPPFLVSHSKISYTFLTIALRIYTLS